MTSEDGTNWAQIPLRCNHGLDVQALGWQQLRPTSTGCHHRIIQKGREPRACPQPPQYMLVCKCPNRTLLFPSHCTLHEASATLQKHPFWWQTANSRFAVRQLITSITRALLEPGDSYFFFGTSRTERKSKNEIGFFSCRIHNVGSGQR